MRITRITRITHIHTHTHTHTLYLFPSQIDVSHPAAKSMIELSRTQDNEVGDGTTSVIIMAGEMLRKAAPFLEGNMHPRMIVGAYVKALDRALFLLEDMSTTIDPTDSAAMLNIVRSCLGTKFMSRFGDKIGEMAIDAVNRVVVTNPETKKRTIDIKRYAKVEKIPGGYLEDSEVLNGLMINKDVVHPKMARKVVNPRILLLDTPLEYKKAESQTNIEITKEGDWDAILKAEEAYIEDLCNFIIAAKPTVIFTEKGVSDLAQHFLMKAGIAVVRRIRKTDNNRVARACGATIVAEAQQITEEHIGTGCGLFEVKKLGDEYFTYVTECKNPKACSVVLRGASKDVLNEMERNLHDAMGVVKNIVLDPRIVNGGGAAEMAVSQALIREADKVQVRIRPMRMCVCVCEPLSVVSMIAPPMNTPISLSLSLCVCFRVPCNSPSAPWLRPWR
jgi:T-complex protein 1 subunit gamma